MSAKIFVIAGEPSGDLHGANLVKQLLAERTDLEIRCWGGDRMAAAGAKVVKHIDELAFMGFVEVLMNLGTILKNFRLCRLQIEEFSPDVVVFIDYPGFNLRMAKHVHGLGVKTVYYISPQVWAWKESRVKKIKKYLDHVFVILPFEETFYQQHGIDAEFVGHPLLDELSDDRFDQEQVANDLQLETDRPVIAVLPGSRRQELQKILPIIDEVSDKFPNHQFLVSKVAWQPLEIYRTHLRDNIRLIEGRTYQLLSAAEVAIVTSGTATLETALIGVPQVVVYRANPISVMIARRLVKIKFISLVNLVMDREVVTELIQNEVSSCRIIDEVNALLPGHKRRDDVLSAYAELKDRLGSKGASSIVAKRLLKILETPSSDER